MSFTSCWFRPRLDAFGAWPTWNPEGDTAARLAKALDEAGHAAAKRLEEHYWAFARSYGADGFARALGAAPLGQEAGVAAARAIAALDYFGVRARVPVPRPASPSSRRDHAIWRLLEPYLADRLIVQLAANAAESIVWRAILARLPTTGVMLDALERAFERRLREQNDSPRGAYRSVKVSLDLRLAAPGVDGWLAERLPMEVEKLRAHLQAGKPALAELICDASVSPLDELVIVYHMEQRADGAWRLVYFDPAAGEQACGLLVRAENGCARFSIEGGSHDRLLPQALRCWSFVPVAPPLFGARRLLRAVLPWRRLWYVGRAARLLFMPRP